MNCEFVLLCDIAGFTTTAITYGYKISNNNYVTSSANMTTILNVLY